MKRSTKVILGICGVVAILLATVALLEPKAMSEIAGAIDPPILPW